MLLRYYAAGVAAARLRLRALYAPRRRHARHAASFTYAILMRQMFTLPLRCLLRYGHASAIRHDADVTARHATAFSDDYIY